MKKIWYLIFVFTVFLFACKKEKVKEFENAFVGNWRMDSVQTSTGFVNNPTPFEIITIFQPNSTRIKFNNSGSDGVGKYILSKKRGISITITRTDEGGWSNGPWLDLYLETMNKAKEYEVNETRLFIITNDNRKIFFTKL
jgi:hypothetical protein